MKNLRIIVTFYYFSLIFTGSASRKFQKCVDDNFVFVNNPATKIFNLIFILVFFYFKFFILFLYIKFMVQLNLFQKHLFLHQLIHNMTKDCSLTYQFST